MVIVPRSAYPALLQELERREVSILLGPRQVGKTHLLKELYRAALAKGLRARYFDLELPHDSIEFNKPDADIFRTLTESLDAVFLDEFHYLKNASKLLKAVYDSGRKVKVYASGSSSIEMHKHLKESLAGRRLVTMISPLSFEEVRGKSPAEPARQAMEQYLVHGGLPGLLHADSTDARARLLVEMLQTYIQKDVKSLIREENIRAFNALLYLLAENQGSLISENSLAREVGLTARTIHHHLSILEKTYVCTPVFSYARRLGNELKKSKKVYFYDLGIRNALLKDYSLPRERPDAGALFESFVFLQLAYRLRPDMEVRFWRDKLGREIDFVVLKNRRPFLIEVKGTLPRPEIPAAFRTFLRAYPETTGGLVVCEGLSATVETDGKPIRFLAPESLGAELDRLGF